MLEALGKQLGAWKGQLEAARLPVRIEVPGRDELIAAGLATLAMGLVLGLAIGPGGAGPGSLLPAYAGPLAATAPLIGEDGDGSSLPTLGSPAGGTSSGGGGGGAPLVAAVAPPAVVDSGSTVPTPVAPPIDDTPVTPAGNGGGGGGGGSGGGDDGEDEAEGLPLTATVVGVSVTGRSYSVADDSGNLFTVYANGVPAVGDRVETGILPLSNGTFEEVDQRRSRGQRTEAKIRGVVSFIDRGVGVMVVSSRGVSVPIDLQPEPAPDLEDQELEVGYDATVDVQVIEPPLPPEDPDAPLLSNRRLRVIAAEATPNPSAAIELTGLVRTVSAGDRTVEVSADSDGLLEAIVTVVAPTSLDLKLLKTGRAYSLTARRTATGELRLTGLSPAFSKKAAGDRKAAFGEHA
jgi:hypothetical protein